MEGCETEWAGNKRWGETYVQYMKYYSTLHGQVDLNNTGITALRNVG